MEGMDSSIMKAIMEALDHVNEDGKEKDGKDPKKMSLTVVEAMPKSALIPEEGMDHDPLLDSMHSEPHMPEMMDGESDDDYLNKLKGMHPDEAAPTLPDDNWSPEDMHDMGPSMIMQMAALKNKKPEEDDDGDHEYR